MDQVKLLGLRKSDGEHLALGRSRDGVWTLHGRGAIQVRDRQGKGKRKVRE